MMTKGYTVTVNEDTKIEIDGLIKFDTKRYNKEFVDNLEKSKLDYDEKFLDANSIADAIIYLECLIDNFKQLDFKIDDLSVATKYNAEISATTYKNIRHEIKSVLDYLGLLNFNFQQSKLIFKLTFLQNSFKLNK